MSVFLCSFFLFFITFSENCAETRYILVSKFLHTLCHERNFTRIHKTLCFSHEVPHCKLQLFNQSIEKNAKWINERINTWIYPQLFVCIQGNSYRFFFLCARKMSIYWLFSEWLYRMEKKNKRRKSEWPERCEWEKRKIKKNENRLIISRRSTQLSQKSFRIFGAQCYPF